MMAADDLDGAVDDEEDGSGWQTAMVDDVRRRWRWVSMKSVAGHCVYLWVDGP